jgi:hypothetical protein
MEDFCSKFTPLFQNSLYDEHILDEETNWYNERVAAGKIS